MALGKAEVQKIARLARIAVKDEELEPLARELSGILGWVEQLGKVDVEDVEPMTSVVAMSLPMRKDEVTDGGHPEDVLANAPERSGGYFVVPKVIE